MKYLLIALLFVSCSTYKAYQRVARDPFVDARESVLLSQKCLTVYPFIRDSAKTITVGVDSAAYNATIDAYNELLDSLISQYESQEGELAFIDTNDAILKSDSLRIIKKFIKHYRPPAIVKTEIKEVPVRNTAWERQKQGEIEACTAEKEAMRQDYQKVTRKLQKRNAEKGWFIAGGLALAVIAFGVGKFSRRI